MHNWCTYSDFFSLCNLIRSSTCPLILTIFKQTQATKCIIDTYTYFVFFSESLRNIFHRLLAGLAVFDTVFLIISMIDSFRRHFRFHQLYVYGWGFSMKWNWLTCFRSWFLSQAQKIITKAKLLPLKPNPFIFMINFIDKKFRNQKN